MTLTPSQSEAAHITDQSVAVVAGAGSGKTRVLIERYRRLLTHDEVPPYKILAFTFTEKAAGEIKERVLKEGMMSLEDEALLQISTIHAFCSRLLRRHGPLLNLDPTYQIASETESQIDRDNHIRSYLHQKTDEQNELVVLLLKQFGFFKLNQLFIQLLNEPFINLHCLANGHDLCSNDKLISLINDCYSEWLKQKIQRATLNFNDLEFLTLKLFETYPQIKAQLQSRYSHILVDEFQDTNPLQGALLDHLYNPQKNKLFIVGDPKQSIYRFRRADISIFRKTVQQIKNDGGRLIQLNETFRIPAELTGVLNQIFQPLFEENKEASFYSPMLSSTSAKGKLHLILSGKEKDPIDKLRLTEAQWIAHTLFQMNLSPTERDATALLFRSGGPIAIYREELVRRGIPCRVTKTEPLLEIPVIRDLMHLLAYLSGDTRPLVQAGLLRSSFFNFSDEFIENIIKSKLETLLSPYIPDLFTTDQNKTQWSKLTEWLCQWNELKMIIEPSALFKVILDDMERGSHKSFGSTPILCDQTALYLEQWLQLIKELESAKDQNPEPHQLLKNIHQKLLHAKTSDKDIKSLDLKTEEGAIHLMTIHAAKGLEFKRVFLPQLYALDLNTSADYMIDPSQGIVLKEADATKIRGLKIQLEETPLFKQLKDQEDQEKREELKRLLYVATTRTQEELFLFLKEPLKKKIRIEESKNWNEWLWHLLENERAHGIPLKIEEAPILQTQQPLFENFSHKLENKFKKIENEKYVIQNPKSDLTSNQQPATSNFIKPTYTVSAIETWLRCEKEYELKYLYGIQALSTSSQPQSTTNDPRSTIHDPRPTTYDLRPTTYDLRAPQWGVLVHEVMQFLDWGNLSNQQTVIEQALVNQHLTDPEKKIEERLNQLIHKMMTCPEIYDLLSKSSDFHSELPFLEDCQDFYIKGTLDRLAKINNIWTVIDYKTDTLHDSVDLEERAQVYWGQMACYAVAASHMIKAPFVNTALIFTDGPSVKIQHWSTEKIKRVQEKLNQIHQSLSHKPVTTYPQNKTICRHCPYWEHNYCGVKNC